MILLCELNAQIGQHFVKRLETSVCRTSAEFLRGYDFMPGQPERPQVAVGQSGCMMVWDPYACPKTMKAGYVPIVMSNGYVLPAGPEWDSFALRVRENSLQEIPNPVKQYLSRWEDMARRARQQWEQFYSLDALLNHLVDNILELKETRRNGRSRTVAKYLKLAREVATEYARPIAGKMKGFIVKK